MLIPFCNHIGIKHRRQIVIFGRLYHFPFPIGVVDIATTIAYIHCQMGKSLPGQVDTLNVFAPLPTIVKVPLIESGKNGRGHHQHQQHTEKLLHHNTF